MARRPAPPARFLGMDPQPRVAEVLLRLLYRFPPLLDRGEIPATALSAHRPQPTLPRVEREPHADGKVLQRLILSEIRRTEDAGAVHPGTTEGGTTIQRNESTPRFGSGAGEMATQEISAREPARRVVERWYGVWHGMPPGVNR